MATKSTSVVIANGQTTSVAYDLGLGPSSRIVGFIMPAAFTGTALTFQVSKDDSTYTALYDSANAQVSFTVAASRAYGFKQDIRAVLSQWSFLKVVSNGTEAADRTIEFVVR
jgi:ABC-type spermidine/putrescine transport system permease subunit II